MENKSHIQFQTLAVLVVSVLLGIKFYAYYITDSNAILSDALESIINVAAGSFALYSLILAAKPSDRDHPYGHGKIEFISSGIEGTLILIAGTIIIYKSVIDLITPHGISDLDIGLYLTAGAGIINYILGWMTQRRGESSKSPTMVASGKHLKSDGYSSAGLVLGLAVVYFTDMVWLDSLIAIAFGLLIGYTGFKEVRRSVAGIMDEADFELLAEITAYVDENRKPRWIDLHNMRAIKFGKKVHVDCHMTLPHYISVQEGHDEVEHLEHLVREKYPEGFEIFIHTDPCQPTSCNVCGIRDCEVRQYPFRERISWTLENVLENEKHQ